MNALRVVSAALGSDLSTNERLVLISVAMVASGTEGTCDYAVTTFERETGLKERAVQYALKSLTEKAVLSRTFRTNESTVYRVLEAGVLVHEVHPRGARRGARRGACTGAPGAPNQIDQRDQRDQIQQPAPAEQEQQPPAPDPALRVEGLHSLKPVDYSSVGELMALEGTANGRDQEFERHVDQASFAAIELALRQGKTKEWLEALMDVAVQRRVRRLSYSWLLGTAPFAMELRDLATAELRDRTARAERNARPVGDHFTPEERRARRAEQQARADALWEAEQARLAKAAK